MGKYNTKRGGTVFYSLTWLLIVYGSNHKEPPAITMVTEDQCKATVRVVSRVLVRGQRAFCIAPDGQIVRSQD